MSRVDHVIATRGTGLVVEHDQSAAVRGTVDAVDGASETHATAVANVDRDGIDGLPGLGIGEPEPVLDRRRLEPGEERIGCAGLEDVPQVPAQRRPLGIPEHVSAGADLASERVLELVGDVVDVDRRALDAGPEVALENGVDERAPIGRRDRLCLARIFEPVDLEHVAEEVPERTGGPALQ